jgi:hypothetical protein
VTCVRTTTRVALASACAALAAAPMIAAAATALPDPSSPLLWSTINVCNTPGHPRMIGIRGSMPGTGDRHEQMYMSFNVEYRGPSGTWHSLSDGGLSAFIHVGNGASVARQAGQDFKVEPTSAARYALRGVVVFEWRLHGRTLTSFARATRAGHTAAAGADPRGYSASTCTISRTGAGRS